jgi:hypothetical protein
MQDLGPDAFPRHLSGLLFDDARAHHWVTAVHDGARARALSPSDALTLGVLLARSSTTGRGETARAAEAALGRSVARRTLRSEVVRDAARLADEVAVASSAGRGEGAEYTHPWLRDAVPALIGALLRADFPRAWALAEESAPLVAALATRRRDADALVPLLETLVRAARGKQATRSDRVDEDDDGRSAVRASAGARALSAALSAVPSTTLATARAWRLLVDAAPACATGAPDARAPTPLMSAVGRALARVSKSSEDRRDELCGTIESKLNGSARARGVGLELLRAVLSAPERPFPLSHVALSVRWALHAASTVDETRDADEASSKTQEIAHGLAISAAATLVAAARYLAPGDLAAIRDGWLAPRLRAQALVWRSGEDAGAPVCTVREHARVPSGERLPLDTVSALFHADLVLTARVDPEVFKARVTRGQTDLRDRRWTEPVDAEETRRSNATEEAVMATLANALQSCLDVDGIDLGDPAAKTRNALLRRLAYLLELRRGKDDETQQHAAATSSTPRVRVSAWLSAVESVLSEDEDETRGVDPRARAGVVKSAAEAVSVAFGLAKDDATGRVSTGAHDPSVTLRALVTRDILRKALKLAERLAPSVADTEDADEKRRRLAERIAGGTAGPSGNPGTESPEAASGERWASTSASTRASVVAGCFEMCFAAAQAPSPPPLEASVTAALAAPALHLETPEEVRDDPDGPDGRLVLLHWITARATECGALRAAVPALALAANVLSALPEETAGACASMVVTAHASAALWGREGGDPDGSPRDARRRAVGNARRFARALFSGTKEERFFLNDVVGKIAEANDVGAVDRARRAGVLEAAHHLAFAHNGASAAVSTLADIAQVLASTANPVPSSAAATNAAVVLHLLAAHARRVVEGMRSSAFAPMPASGTLGSPSKRAAGDAAATLRLGRLMCQTLDAVTATVKRNGFAGNGVRASGGAPMTVDTVAEALRGANAALAALVSAGNYSPQGGGGSASASSRFDDVAHSAYQSAGRLGAAVDARSTSLASGELGPIRSQTTRLRTYRTSLRAVVALRGGERLTDDVPAGDDPESRASSKFRRKYGKLHWVDLAAEEPSSEESESDASEEDDDEEMFCVRPNGGEGIAGWGLVDGRPFPEAKPAPIRRRGEKKKERRSSDREDGEDGDGEMKASPRDSAEKPRKRKGGRRQSEDPMSDDDEEADGSNASFVSLLEKLHRKHGGKLRVPTFCGQKLDLPKLFAEVQSRGGSEAVTESRKWKQVALAMCSDLEGQTAASYAIKSKFLKVFQGHEARLAEQFSKKKKHKAGGSEQENETP